MENPQEIIKTAFRNFKNSATVHIFTIGILVLVLLIPAYMIQSLINERESRKKIVINEVSSKWGASQTITGPFLTIPYKTFIKDGNEKGIVKLSYLHILPEMLNVSGVIKPELRHRSLYEVVLYNTNLEVNGTFKIPPLPQLNIEPENILWEKSFLSIGITDLRGIQDKVKIKLNDVNYDCNSGLKTTDIVSSGVGTLIAPLLFDQENKFSFSLNLNGSENLHFIPIAETNTIQLQSTWPSPSFNGAYLPTTNDVSEKGFTANWKVLHFNRNYPQYWNGNQFNVEPSAFGLELILTADTYQKTTRIAKYAIMFIVFTFSAFFFSERINKRRVHPIQYILIGLAILLFYTLLLSLSEKIDFNLAYILSATAITFLITGYSRGIIKDKKFVATIFGLLSILYSFLFIVLQLEDYALLMGSIGLLIVLSTVMYITRKVDWYATETV